MSKSRKIDPCRFIFVVGTPGAGKSLFCRELEVVLGGKNFKCSRHGDYPYLQLLYRTDPRGDRSKRFRRGTAGAEFVVLDPAVYDEALRLVHDNVLAPSGNEETIRIIEFARPHYDTAFIFYTLRVLSQSVIVHISTTLDVCIQRNENRKRILDKLKQNLESRLRGSDQTELFDENPDLHYVPPEVMADFYAKDSEEDDQRSREQRLVLSLMPARGYFAVDNSSDDLQLFRETARALVEERLIPFIKQGEPYDHYYLRRLAEIGKTLTLFPPG